MSNKESTALAKRRAPESELWAAVVLRAWADVFEVPMMCNNPSEFVRAREEALRFLTDESGPWARQRAIACALIGGGEDPDRLRERAVRQMKLTPPPPLPADAVRYIERKREAALCRSLERSAATAFDAEAA